MKKSTSAVLAVSVVALALGGAYFFASGDQLQGRFSNLSVKPLDQVETDSKFKSNGEGKFFEGKIDFSGAIDPYFLVNSYITSNEELDLTEDDQVIVGHLTLSPTSAFTSSKSVDYNFSGIIPMVAGSDGSFSQMFSMFDDCGVDVVDPSGNRTTTQCADFGSYPDYDFDSAGEYVLEYWVNPSSAISYDEGVDYFLELRSLWVQPDNLSSADTYHYSLNDSDGQNIYFDVSDVTSTNAIKSLMTFSF